MKMLCPMPWDERVIRPEIAEYYGSLKSAVMGTARERFRLPDVDENTVKKITSKVSVAYPLNVSCLGSLKQMEENTQKYIDFIGHIEDLGFKHVIIAHPYLIPLAKRHTKLKVDVSTICEVNSVTEIEHFCGMEVDRITLSTSINKEFKFFERLSDFDIEFIILVNECCIPFCIFRKSHYSLQGHTEESASLDYPFDLCRRITVQDFPLNFLRSGFIRPEDLKLYDEYNIGYYKISGRTLPTEWINETTDAYLKGEYHGNVFDLSPMVEGTLKLPEGEKHLFIDNDSLEGFLPIIKGVKLMKTVNSNCRFDCGSPCRVCFMWADNLRREGKSDRMGHD